MIKLRCENAEKKMKWSQRASQMSVTEREHMAAIGKGIYLLKSVYIKMPTIFDHAYLLILIFCIFISIKLISRTETTFSDKFIYAHWYSSS